MRVNRLVPEAYYKESRDFAFIGRLIEVVFNYMKSCADITGIGISNQDINPLLVDLTAITLGFEAKHKYDDKNLIAIISSFTELVRNKGSMRAIEAAIQLMLTVQNIQQPFECKRVKENGDKYVLNIILPAQIRDVILLEDLFDYLLPAGFVYKITKAQTQDKDSNISTTALSQKIYDYEKSDADLGQISKTPFEIKEQGEGDPRFYIGLVSTEGEQNNG